MANLAAAFELFRRGHFNEATGAALQLLGENPQHYWALYLAAISSAFAHEIREFEKHLSALESAAEANRVVAEEGSVYLHYLKAYYALLSRDTEKALWHYLEIAEEPEGWLARSLIKKFRKVREIDNIAYRVADFIVLPPQLPPPAKPAATARQKTKQAAAEKPVVQGWQFGQEKPGARSRLRLSFGAFSLRRLLFAGLVAVAVVLAVFWLRRAPRPVSPAVPELQIADSAAVMPVEKHGAALYVYKSREKIIDDFEQAKRLLAQRKVNQCRYVLGRLIYSNADFQSREKAKIFIGFIPDPGFAEFSDNLPLADLFRDVRARQLSVVLTAGELRDSQLVAGGTTYQFIVREGGQEYRVHAFRDSALPEEKLQTAQSGKHIQVYGRFKGLIGDQRAIYLEALRVWR